MKINANCRKRVKHPLPVILLGTANYFLAGPFERRTVADGAVDEPRLIREFADDSNSLNLVSKGNRPTGF